MIYSDKIIHIYLLDMIPLKYYWNDIELNIFYSILELDILKDFSQIDWISCYVIFKGVVDKVMP